MKANCNDEKCHSTKNHSGWPALKMRTDVIGAAAVVEMPQNYGICGQSGRWWNNGGWTASDAVQEIIVAGAAFQEEEVQQIPPPGYENQDGGGYEYAPPDAYVEEVLDEE